MGEGFIPKHGGYQDLKSYQKAEVVYDATVYFCRRFIDKFSRTTDQMIQAARSGKQNIIEGSMASAMSKEMEIKVTSFLLDRQIEHLEQAFIEEGGLRERMTRARLVERERQKREAWRKKRDVRDEKDPKDAHDS